MEFIIQVGSFEREFLFIEYLDFHDHHNDTFCYLCSINQHEHERTKPRDESKVCL